MRPTLGPTLGPALGPALFMASLACAPRAGVAPEATAPDRTVRRDEAAPVVEVFRPLDGVTWTHITGLQLDIPDGWSGAVLEGERPLVLRHRASGSQLDVIVHDAVPDGPGCEASFSDDRGHRAVPALTPSTTWTCPVDDGAAGLIRGWRGEVAGQVVDVVLTTPPGAHVAGRVATDDVFRALRSR